MKINTSMKLRELTKLSESKLEKYQRIAKWIEDHRYVQSSGGQSFNDLTIRWNNDGTVDTIEQLAIDTDDGTIPFQFRRAHRGFSLMTSTSNVKPITMKGCPHIVNGSFSIDGDISFEGSPEIVNGSYFCTDFTSLKGIEKHVKSIGRSLYLYSIERCILGAILIRNLKEIKFDGNYDADRHDKFEAIKIVNKHLGKGKAGILAAQTELIDADLDDFAEI